MSPATDAKRSPNQFEQPRHGLAALEFVMCLPVLLTMFFLIMWLGLTAAAQTKMTVKARNDAWRQRFDDKSKKPFVFTTNRIQYSAERDFASGKASTTVDVSPMFNRFPKPEAEFTVLSGAWDHRALPMTEPPSWTQYANAAGNAATGELQELVGSLDGLVNNLSQELNSQIDGSRDQGNSIETEGSGVDSGTKNEEKAKKNERAAENARCRHVVKRFTTNCGK